MLVLSRKPNESVAINYPSLPEIATVKVTVLSIRGKQVQIGLEGPQEARFLRSELVPRVDSAAAAPSPAVADVLTRTARLLDAQTAGRTPRDAETLRGAAIYLRSLAGDQV